MLSFERDHLFIHTHVSLDLGPQTSKNFPGESCEILSLYTAYSYYKIQVLVRVHYQGDEIPIEFLQIWGMLYSSPNFLDEAEKTSIFFSVATSLRTCILECQKSPQFFYCYRFHRFFFHLKNKSFALFSNIRKCFGAYRA